MPRISVAIITRDEAQRLPAALASVTWADEVVVLDSGSTDGTPALAAAAGARVVVEPWRGYGAMKQRAAALCTHPWVFSLDADERVGAVLATAVQRLPATPAPAAFRVRRRNHVGGRAIRHAPWAWDWQVRLFDRTRAGFSTAAVHESVQTQGPVHALPGVLDHLTYRDWADGAARNQRYARLWAAGAAAAGRRAGWADVHLRPAWAYLRGMLLRGQFRSGLDGHRWSRLQADAVRWKYDELRAQRAGGSGASGAGVR
jgi:glycosyltransferase involved in cell wall biosynthesis